MGEDAAVSLSTVLSCRGAAAPPGMAAAMAALQVLEPSGTAAGCCSLSLCTSGQSFAAVWPSTVHQAPSLTHCCVSQGTLFRAPQPKMACSEGGEKGRKPPSPRVHCFGMFPKFYKV
jgi:hypothetical protein